MDLMSGDKIAFQAANPKRRKTCAWERYERYKIATTVQEARSLGATPEDLRHDISKVFAVVLSRHETPLAKRQKPEVPEVTDAPRWGQANGASMALMQEAPAQGFSTLSSQDGLRGGEAHGTSTMSSSAASSQKAPPGDEALEQAGKVAIQRLQQELVAARRCITELQAEVRQKSESVAKLQAELAKARAMESSLNPGPSLRDDSAPAEADMRGPQAVERLALRACAAVESRASAEDRSRVKATATWIKWLVAHIPEDSHMLRYRSKGVVAAVILHAAWGLEFGKGLPLARTLDHAIASSWPVLNDGPRTQILLMKFLGLTAGECEHSKAVYAKLVRMVWAKGPLGLPGRPAEKFKRPQA